MIDLGLKKKKKARKPAAKKEAASGTESKGKRRKDVAWKVLVSPHVTEKATEAAKNDHYFFKVASSASKTEIGKAVEDLYGVDVTAVKIVNVPAKKKRLGRMEGWKKGYKKAAVKLKKGQKIEVLPR